MEIAVISLSVLVLALVAAVVYLALRQMKAFVSGYNAAAGTAEERGVEREALLDRIHALAEARSLREFKEAVAVPGVTADRHDEAMAQILADAEKANQPMPIGSGLPVGGGSVI